MAEAAVVHMQRRAWDGGCETALHTDGAALAEVAKLLRVTGATVRAQHGVDSRRKQGTRRATHFMAFAVAMQAVRRRAGLHTQHGWLGTSAALAVHPLPRHRQHGIISSKYCIFWRIQLVCGCGVALHAHGVLLV